MHATATKKALGLKLPCLMVGVGALCLFVTLSFGLKVVLPIFFSDRAPEHIIATSKFPLLYRNPGEFVVLFLLIAFLSLATVLSGVVIYILRRNKVEARRRS